MYYNGQIIYDNDTKKPFKVGGTKNDTAWAWSNLPRRNTHFLKSIPGFKYDVALPQSIEEAQDLLDKGIITPAPCPVTHCWDCGNWLSNHNPDGTCWK